MLEMDILDTKYLSMQFTIAVFKKNASEFQTLFEAIMEKVHEDFQKVRPYGNKGDGGNDGYIPTKGIYFQVYSPKNPNEKEAVAAKKLKDDFNKLKNHWDHINKITKYCFVYNDKGYGISIELAAVLAELGKADPGIHFSVFTIKDLEKVFLSLNTTDLALLGFDVDIKKALSLAFELLERLDTLLDWNSSNIVLESLDHHRSTIEEFEHDKLNVKYELIKARALEKQGKVNQAVEICANLIVRFPEDSSAYLFLTNVALVNGDIEVAENLLSKAELCMDSNWMLNYLKIVIKYVKAETIPATEIEESSLPKNNRVKSFYYRLISLIKDKEGNSKEADVFIQKAIYYNGISIKNHDVKLSLLENRIREKIRNKEESQQLVEDYFAEISHVRDLENDLGPLSKKDDILLRVRRIDALLLIGRFDEIEKNIKDALELLVTCNFDSFFSRMLVKLLYISILPDDFFLKLQNSIIDFKTPISSDLAKAFLIQFAHKGDLGKSAKDFYRNLNLPLFVDFITHIEKAEYNNAIGFIIDDFEFSVHFVNSLRSFPAFKKTIIEELNFEEEEFREKLLFSLHLDMDEYDEAYEILKKIQLQKLEYYECIQFWKVASEKKAWDFELILVNRMLELEKNETRLLRLRVHKLNLYENLEMFLEGVKLGEEILSNPNIKEVLDDNHIERVIWRTAQMMCKREKYTEAQKLIEKFSNYIKTSNFKIWLASNIFLNTNNIKLSINSIVDGIKNLNRPTPEDYGRLFPLVTQICNSCDFELISDTSITKNRFVKFENEERWFYVGDEEELDASKIPIDDVLYSVLLEKNIGEVVEFNPRYRSSRSNKIERVFTIERYIFWQAIYYAKKLTEEGRWNELEIVELPTLGSNHNLENLERWFADDSNRKKAIFDAYCNQRLPLALLAYNEGGLTNAIGKIVNEERGYVNFCFGTKEEYEKQNLVAKRIISGEEFYIDGTSALVLSEFNFLDKIKPYIKGICIPQSIISFLYATKEKFQLNPGLVGYLGYSNGNLRFSSVDNKRSSVIRANIQDCIDYFENHCSKALYISKANRFDCFSEQDIYPELCDACIYAQKDRLPVLTEDPLYLEMNSLQTQKSVPDHTSSFALVREIYLQNLISFEDYLSFLSYLASYRFRFLSINVSDLELAVFGSEDSKNFAPNRFKLFHPWLTLSKEYGVDPQQSIFLVWRILYRAILDEGISSDAIEGLIDEIATSFLVTGDNTKFSETLLPFMLLLVETMKRKESTEFILNRIEIIRKYLMRSLEKK